MTFMQHADLLTQSWGVMGRLRTRQKIPLKKNYGDWKLHCLNYTIAASPNTEMYTHLHLHTQYSLLEGAIRIPALTKALHERGFSACAITDHGNMFGVPEFYHTLKDAGLKPLIGMGAFISGTTLQSAGIRNGRRMAQTQLLCLNRQGYQNLSMLASLAFTEGKQQGMASIEHNLFEQFHEGLIAFSGGLDGEISQPLLNGRIEDARRLASWYKEVFSGRFYFELQNTGLESRHALNHQLVELGQELDIPLLASNNCFYIMPEEAEAQHILWLMGQQYRVTDDGVPGMKSNAFSLKTEEEMREVFAEFSPEVMENTGRIAEQCELALENAKVFLPNFEAPPEHSLESWLRKQANEGLERRLGPLFELYSPESSFEDFRATYDARLTFELDVIIQMDFPGYFLIVADFINWAKDHGVSVGPGRGSGAGSLTAYALRITDIDPIRYGLLFERFLNPDRISLPDFDIDFDVYGRDRVIEYVRRRYGEQNVCQISTFGTLKAKAAVRGVARVLDFTYSEADKIAKLVPNELNIALDEAIHKEPGLARMASEGSEQERRLLDLSRKLEGLSTHLGTHAAGVIIMNQDIREVMPVCTGREGALQSMYPMKYAEDQGAVKFDFLGLQNLSTIDDTLELVNRDRPPEARVDITRIPMNDRLTFNMLANADTAGVFQLESSGMKRLVAEMKPSSFEDIVAILALYRPGPLGSGMVEDFVQCKHGRKQVVYPHPLLGPILKETYGVMVYQEQIMQAVQVLAGFSLGQADLLRRAIGKKDPTVLAEQRERFVQGCLNNPEYVEGCRGKDAGGKANDIFDLIDYFSGYGFNKSHTVAYGMISCQTAYLKAHYPVQFMAALLNGASQNPDKVVSYIGDCKEMGVSVLPPDVNLSLKSFSVSPIACRITSRTIAHLDPGFPGSPFAGNNGLPETSAAPLKHLFQNFTGEKYDSVDDLLKALMEHAPEDIMDFLKLSLRENLNDGKEISPSNLREWLNREARVEAVRFGLSAVKNVGGNAVDSILEVRKQHGQLKDFLEFLKAVDLNRMNKRMLETLVHCGAFDSIESNRARLDAVLEEALHLAQEHQRSESTGQQTLFELMAEEDAKATETVLRFPEIRDWRHHHRLKQEKESLGFYVSGHPLDRYASEVKQLAVSTSELQEGLSACDAQAGKYAEQEAVSVAGIVVSKTVRLNRNSEKFAIIVIEDLRGTLEFPVFAKVYAEAAEFLDGDDPLLITGRINLRDESVSLMVDSVQALSEVRLQQAHSMTIEIASNELEPEKLRLLRNLMQKYPGEKPVHFLFHTEEGTEVKIHVQEKTRFEPAFIEELEEERQSWSLTFSYGEVPKTLLRHANPPVS